jgi:N-glycosylase/DNA lyase
LLWQNNSGRNVKIAKRQQSIAELGALYGSRKREIRTRLTEFRRVPPSDYFYELVYCILTPQSSARNAATVVQLLRDYNFERREIDPTPVLRQKESYIRFHGTKAKRLQEIRKEFPTILQQLTDGSPSEKQRRWLVENVKGLGYKEASHFLRNIGHRNLAILDRHILKNLLRFGVIDVLPKNLTPKMYLEIENRFRLFAEKVGIPVDELDLLFWSMETGEVLK